MVFWMKKAARSIKTGLHDSIDAALRRATMQGLALTGMVFFAVAREGLELVFFLLATFQQNVGIWAPIGALAGLACASGVGVAIYYRRRKAQSPPLLPLDRRVHPVRRRRPSRRLAPCAA